MRVLDFTAGGRSNMDTQWRRKYRTLNEILDKIQNILS